MGLVQTKIEISIETSPQLIESLHMAREVTLKSDAAEVLPAHLVLAMLEDDESSFLLDAYGVDFNKIRTQLGKIVQKQVKPKSQDRHAVFSAGIEMIMQHARQQAQKNALAEVDSNLILAVILSEKSGFLGSLLAPYDLDTSGVLQYLELREGKTVNIDPLPSMQIPADRTQKSDNNPARARAPKTTPGAVSAPAPNSAPQSAQRPPPIAGVPVANNQAPNAPWTNHQPVQMPPGHTGARSSASPHLDAAAQQAPASPMQPPPMPAMPPAREGHNPPSAQPLREQGLTELSNNPQGLSLTSEAGPSSASATPSRLRSMFGGLGKKLKGKINKQHETAAQSAKPAVAPTRLVPAPANNNQSPAPTPILASLDQLVDPAISAQLNASNTPVSRAPMNQHNRPAKRRRAVPASLGSNESLSATGSVLEKGRLVEAVPRKMKMNKPSRAEVRITREQLDEINSEFEDLSSSHIHDLAVTEAMTVQLRAPGSGFHIENLSPQTQWIDRNQRHINDADFGVWRWNVTPTRSGKSRLQLVISARTVDDDGNIHIADIPDKIIELSIAKDYAKDLKNLAFIAFMVMASLALGRYGEAAWQWVSGFVSKLGL